MGNILYPIILKALRNAPRYHRTDTAYYRGINTTLLINNVGLSSMNLLPLNYSLLPNIRLNNRTFMNVLSHLILVYSALFPRSIH